MSRAPLLCLLITGLLLCGPRRPVHGKEEAATPEARAARLVHAAVEAGDAAALKRLASADQPDPWLVADELIRLGHPDTAAAFATAAPRAAVAALPDYVARLQSRTDPGKTREVLTAVSRAFAAGDWDAAASAAARLADPPATVPGARLRYLHGLALARQGELDEAARRLLDGARVSQDLGWLAAAVGYYGKGAHIAYQRSDFETALEALRAARTLQVRLGRAIDAARTWATIGLVHEKRGEYAEALVAQRGALTALREAGDEAGATGVLGNLGILHMQMGDYEDALRVLREALAFWQKHQAAAWVATTLGRIALVQEKQDDFTGALKTHRRVLAFQVETRDEESATRTRANIGNLLARLGDFPAALAIQNAVLAAKRARKDRAGEALTLSNIGVIYWSLSDYESALRMHERALTLRRAIGDKRGEANSLSNIGVTHLEFGDYAASLRTQEAALTLQQQIGDREGAATTSGNIGRLYMEIGDHAKARTVLERTQALWKALGNRTGESWTLNHLGMVLQREGDPAEALGFQQRALALWKAVEHDPGAVFTRSRLGVLWRDLGRYPEAVAVQKEVITLATALPNRDLVVRTRGHLGLTYALMDKRDEALELLESTVREARELRMTPVLARFLGELARLRLDDGDAGRALTEARSAVRELEGVLGGLGEEEGAAARSRHADVFGIGALAAARLGEVDEVFTFLESGRAGSLLESLRGRRALQWTDLPKDLREIEAAAKAEEARARHELARIANEGTQREVHTAARRLDAAHERLREISARIQREAKRQAGLFYPRATTLEKLRPHLDADAAFVEFGLCMDQTLALVVTRRRTRVVSLGPTAAIEAACNALDLGDPDAPYEKDLAALRRLLVAPLELPSTVRTLLISPDGALCYLPHGLLFDGRNVALLPSATTHVLLREESRPRGRDVLALGDPLYESRLDPGASAIYRAGHPPPPLPATRKEVEAVGTVRLLGEQAHERGLRESLRLRPRWRAVHLACHGLVDPERPTLSSLALTQEGTDDGFLTCLEVLRARIPADLVALSACSTARGRTYRAEGVVGLMRSFMYAGAPRVLCSLWNVDDEATLALMRKFYALWASDTADADRARPGAAEALRAAQRFVREHPDHPEWRHPYYWAAWILWGLPGPAPGEREK